VNTQGWMEEKRFRDYLPWSNTGAGADDDVRKDHA
jgi:hypothetical protein